MPLDGAASFPGDRPEKIRHSGRQGKSSKICPLSLAKRPGRAYIGWTLWGRTGFDGDVEAGAAGRGAAGLVKSGNQVIANDNDYAYACAA